MLDWTWVDRTYAILWAQIPYRGRTFPLAATVHGAQGYGSTAAEIALLERIRDAWPKDGPTPLLLADGGFPKVALVDWLCKHGWFFIIRGQKNQAIRNAWDERCTVDEVPAGTTVVIPNATLFGHRQRRRTADVVISVRYLEQRQEDGVWVLLTNLPPALRARATRLYRHRMQGEQTHRDCKRGHFVSGYALSHQKRMRPDRLERLLFFVGLCYAFIILIAETASADREWFKRRHWGMSLSKFGLDLARHLGTRLRQTIKQALVSGPLRPLWLESGDS